MQQENRHSRFAPGLFGLDEALGHAVGKASCGITVVDCRSRDQTLIYANPSFLSMTGYSFDELEGRNLRVLQGTDRSQPARSSLRNAIDEGTPATVTMRNYRKNGTSFLHRFRIEPVPASAGSPTLYVGIHEDVTQQQAARDGLLEHAKVIQAGRLAALGELAVGVSHEVKNPLMMMTGLLELALQGLANGDVESATSDIRDALQASTRITGVLSRLQAFAQRSSDTPEIVDLRELLERTANLVAERFRLAGIAIELECPTRLLVRGFPDVLGQVFLHLFINAREALGESGGRLSVRATVHEEHRIEVVVQDTGPGVPESLRDRIFDPFFSTKPASSGTGLGLAISQEAVRAHGGHLSYQAVPGAGATFRLELPRCSLGTPTPPSSG